MFSRLSRSELKAAWPPLLSIGILFFFPWAERAIAAIWANDLSNFVLKYGAGFCIALTCVVYGISLRYLHRQLKQVERDLPDIWFLFLITSVLLCFCFAVYLDFYLMLPSWTEGEGAKAIVHQRNLWDALYFAVVTFTTVGYGDIVPVSPAAKLMASFIALFGITHAVTFVTVIVQTASRKN